MNSNIIKNIKRVFSAFGKMEKMPKKLLRYGFIAAFLLFTAGTLMLFFNNMTLAYDNYINLTAKLLVKASVTITAEVLIGGLVLDYLCKASK